MSARANFLCLCVQLSVWPFSFALTRLSLACFPARAPGYLATMLLLDESKELHLMVTNSLKQDMNNPNAGT